MKYSISRSVAPIPGGCGRGNDFIGLDLVGADDDDDVDSVEKGDVLAFAAAPAAVASFSPASAAALVVEVVALKPAAPPPPPLLLEINPRENATLTTPPSHRSKRGFRGAMGPCTAQRMCVFPTRRDAEPSGRERGESSAVSGRRVVGLRRVLGRG